MLSKGPTREFSKARHAQRRELQKARRAAVKGTDWRSNQGLLFAERGGWLLGVLPMMNLVGDGTCVRLQVKPMAIDPIFWEVVGHPELRHQPLSFRFYGWMQCWPLIIEEQQVSEEGGVDALAGRVVQLGDATLKKIADEWTAADFIRGIDSAINPGRLFKTKLMALLAERRFDEAQRLCDDAHARANQVFWSSSRGPLKDMMAAWIGEQQDCGKPSSR